MDADNMATVPVMIDATAIYDGSGYYKQPLP